jgi:hypothetical protein
MGAFKNINSQCSALDRCAGGAVCKDHVCSCTDGSYEQQGKCRTAPGGRLSETVIYFYLEKSQDTARMVKPVIPAASANLGFVDAQTAKALFLADVCPQLPSLDSPVRTTKDAYTDQHVDLESACASAATLQLTIVASGLLGLQFHIHDQNFQFLEKKISS